MPAQTSASRAPQPPPSYLQDAHYPGASKLGRGIGYEYPHDLPDGVSDQPLMPEGLEERRYYEPRQRGFERELQQRLDWLRKQRETRQLVRYPEPWQGLEESTLSPGREWHQIRASCTSRR